MANDLIIPRGFQVERISKAGKITTRDALGVLMSGNKDERSQLCEGVMSGIWAQEADVGNFHPIFDNIARVFPEAVPWMRTVRSQRFPSKAQSVVLFESVSLLTGRNGNALKGEKAMLVKYCGDFVAQYHADLAAKEERKAAYEAKQLEGVEVLEDATDTADAGILGYGADQPTE